MLGTTNWPTSRGSGRAETEISGTDETPGWDVSYTTPITWKELEWLRSSDPTAVGAEGASAPPRDAHVAVESGVNGVLVSTHGGRQLDMTMGAIEMLPEVVEAVNGRAEVYLDSGVRRGSDVVKALALGAQAVGIGRPLFWGLALNGAEGVHGVLELLREEVDRAMAYCGQTSVQNLDAGVVNIPQRWGAGRFSG